MPRSRIPAEQPDNTTSGEDAQAPKPAQATTRVAYARTATPDPVEAEALAKAQAGDHHAFAHLYSCLLYTSRCV